MPRKRMPPPPTTETRGTQSPNPPANHTIQNSPIQTEPPHYEFFPGHPLKVTFLRVTFTTSDANLTKFSL